MPARWILVAVVVACSGCQWRKTPDEKAKDTVISHLNSDDLDKPAVTFEAVRWGPVQPWRQQDDNRQEAARLRQEADRLTERRVTSQHTAQAVTLTQLQAAQARATPLRLQEHRLRRTADSLDQVRDTTRVAQAIFIVYRMSPGRYPLDSAWFTVWPSGLVLFANAPGPQPAAGRPGR